jgi:hypothetical protein
MPNHILLVPPREQLLTLLLRLIWNILEKVDDGVIHFVEVHAVVFYAPGWRI